MAVQNLIPGAGFIDGVGTGNNLVPGIGLIQESASTAPSHSASGAIAGSGAVVSGAAAHVAVHATSGAPTGSGSYVVGSAARVVSNSITLTDLTNYRVYQRSGTSKSVTVSGTYAGVPTTIQARIVQDGTSTEVVTWTTIDAAPAGNAFSGAITVPQGGWYNVQVRFSNDTGVTSNGTNKFGVGIIALCVGQSNMENWFVVGTHSAVSLAAKQSGSVYGGSSGTWAAMSTTGNGANEFAAQLIATYGIPVGMLAYAVGGTVIAQWDQSTDAYPRNAIKAAQDVGGAVEYILWAQGEGDGLSGTAQSTYETGLTNCISNFRAQITNGSGETNLPFLLSILGRGTSIGTDAQAAAIRAGQFNVAAAIADVYVAATAFDLPLADAAHYTSAGYVTHGARFAQTVRYILGDSTYHRGPYITNAKVVDSTHIDVTITHRGGTDFTPTTAINGFEIDDGGTIVVPSAANRQSATVIRLTHTAVGSTATLRYGYGADGGVTFAYVIADTVADNSAVVFPLEQFEGQEILDPHTSTGDIVGAGSVVSGVAARAIAAEHPVTGSIIGENAIIVGSASRTNAIVTHSASGALTGTGASIVGSALTGAMTLTAADLAAIQAMIPSAADIAAAVIAAGALTTSKFLALK